MDTVDDQEEIATKVQPNNSVVEEASNDDIGITTPFRILELGFAFGILAIALAVEYAAMPQYIRAIPVQEATIVNATSTTSTLYIRNLQYNEELQNESIGTEVLILVGVILPMLLQMILAGFCQKVQQPVPLMDIYNTFCSYLLAFSVTLLVVDATKLYCGYLRPHFYDICEPTEEHSYQTCTNEDEKELREIRDSFPSGHAALALSGLLSLSLYLNKRLGVGILSRDKANSRSHFMARWWNFLSVLPVLVALYIGVSRIHDNYHHPADVVGGFGIGAVIAYFFHHVYFLE